MGTQNSMSTTELMQKLKKRERLSARQIKELFDARRDWDTDISIPLAQQALDQGENFLAYDIAEQSRLGDDNFAEGIRIMALALARSGSLKRAAEIAARLPDSDDTEIVGLKSRILKDIAINTPPGARQREYFIRAGELSLDIFNRKRMYYNGINAASCLLMGGRAAEAKKLVREEVLPLCQREEKRDLWHFATLGECHLLLEDYAAAGEYYHTAAQIAINDGQLGNFTSTLKQFHMLADRFDRERIDRIVERMELPTVAVFSGHMIDRPGRKTPRFPEYAEEQVRRDLAGVIRRRGIRIGCVSCACGGDIIFAEEVLKSGGECFLFPALPMESEIRNSVDFIPGSRWKERLEALLHHKNVTLIEPECDEIGVEDDAIVYEFTNRFLLGSAIGRAAAFRFPLCGVAVWNLEESGLTGGTDSAVRMWKELNMPIEIVTPEIKQ